MPTPSGHTRAIAASRVTGTSVYNRSGEKIGHVEDIVLDKMSGEEKNLFQFAFWAGIRTSELIALEWGDIDWQRGTVQVRRALTRAAIAAMLCSGAGVWFSRVPVANVCCHSVGLL